MTPGRATITPPPFSTGKTAVSKLVTCIEQSRRQQTLDRIFSEQNQIIVEVEWNKTRSAKPLHFWYMPNCGFLTGVFSPGEEKATGFEVFGLYRTIRNDSLLILIDVLLATRC